MPANDDSVGGSAFAPYEPAVHSDGKFQYLCSLATTCGEEEGFEFNVNASDDDAEENPDPPPPNPFSSVTTPGGNDLNIACNQMTDISDDKLFDFYTNGELELFSNGLGLAMVSEEGRLLKGVVENDKSKATFLGDRKWSDGLSVELQVLPFLWHMRRNGRVHFFADVFMSTTIIAEQLGFDSPIQYVECRGWTFSKKGGEANLQYRKLEQVIEQLAPTKRTAELAMNFNAMVDMLYKHIIGSQGIKNVYSGKPSVRFLEKKSFISKLHQQTQEFQVAVIITKTFFIDHVSDHVGDLLFWIKTIFRQCRVRKDFTMLCNNMLMLFDDSGNPELAKLLLSPTYLDCIRDEVSRRAIGLQQKMRYEARLEEMIGKLGRATKRDVMPSKSRSLLFARARVRDMVYPFMSREEKLTFQSSTRKRKGNKNTTRKVQAGKCCVKDVFILSSQLMLNPYPLAPFC